MKFEYGVLRMYGVRRTAYVHSVEYLRGVTCTELLVLVLVSGVATKRGDEERRRQCEEFGCGYGVQSCMLRVHTRACVWPESETAVGSIEGHGVGETVSSHRGRVVSDRTC